MPSNDLQITHVLAGGLASSFGDTANVELQANGDGSVVAQVPFLLRAKNVAYTLDGGFRKIGGQQAVHPTSQGGQGEIRGLVDFWRHSAGVTRQYVVWHQQGQIRALDDWTTSFQINDATQSKYSHPTYETFDDELIIMSDDDVPLVWNGAGLAEILGTNTPNFSFATKHKNRLFAAGDPSNPSRLYIGPTLADGGPRADWGDAAGLASFIDIEPGDGDVITGVRSYKNECWVFKGPNKGSIHRIPGSTTDITASDPFRKEEFLNSGLGSVGHTSIFQFGDDIGFVWADGSIHTLKATSAFGDFNEASLSNEINTELSRRVNRKALYKTQAATWVSRNLLMVLLPMDNSDFANVLAVMDFRFERPRWSLWEDYNSYALAQFVDTSRGGRHSVMVGGSDRLVYRIDTPDYANEQSGGGTGDAGDSADTAYEASVLTPGMQYGSARDQYTLKGMSAAVVPMGDAKVYFRWKRDGKPAQTANVTHHGGDTLGPPFVLGASTLGGGSVVNRAAPTPEGGTFNVLSMEIYNGDIDDGMEIHGFTTTVERNATSVENA